MAGEAKLGVGSEYYVSRYRMELDGEECSTSRSPLDKEMVRTRHQRIAETNGSREFVRTEISKAFVWYLLLDLCYYTVSISPYKTIPAPDIFSDSLPRQASMSLIVGVVSYCSLNLRYALFSGLTVGIGMYAPQDWPPLMGRLREISTVRGFWGKFWQQQLRRVRSVPFFVSKFVLLMVNRNSPSPSTCSTNTSIFDMVH
jgi:hypothetical protein